MSSLSTTIVGCLLDVSNSMRQALESGRSDERAIERLRAVLSAALKIAQREQQGDPHARMFVGVFGLEGKYPPCVDLCGVIDMLLGSHEGNKTGHQLLIALANRNNLSHITKYIETKLKDDDARLVHMYLRRHPERIREFVDAIPSEGTMKTVRTTGQVGGATTLAVAGFFLLGPIGAGAGALLGGALGNEGAAAVEDDAVDRSEAIKLANRICKEWLQDFAEFIPRPISDVVQLLQRLQDHPAAGGRRNSDTLLDTLRQYLYGWTPMRDAMERSLNACRKHTNTKRRVLVLISDGESTDGDPVPVARKLKNENITVAAVYLTSNERETRRRLYDRAAIGWSEGQRTLFNMVAKVPCTSHPIPVLASVGWEVPSSGECALYTTVCSVVALDEFCSLLLSARFGSADALLDIIGRVQVDTFVDDKYVVTCKNPSDQGASSTCYAHATAAVIHMSLLRIVGREGGCPSIKEIRDRILLEFPAKVGGRNVEEVLTAATAWYRIRFRKVGEDAARQAVLRRRPVLTTFHLSNSGWKAFGQHFDENAATRNSVLTRARMAPYKSQPSGGGHAVVLYSCDPHSLTFLNSWGSTWGKAGSFSVQDHTTLDISSVPARFYDVYWLESNLTALEKQAYDTKVQETLRRRSKEHPSILELEARCPRCYFNSPIADFKGNIRQAICPRPSCQQSFAPEPGHLVQALYARAGLSDAI